MLSIRDFVSASFVMLAMICAPACAVTLSVTNINDSGAGSLRDTLAAAASNDRIVFAPGVTGSIALLSPLTTTLPVTIQGPGAANLTLDGQANVQIMVVSAGTLTLSGVTIANAKTAGFGGGINILGGATLTVSNSVFAGNVAGNGGGIAVADDSFLTVDTCTFENNTTTGVGGGAFLNLGTAMVSNSTLSGNTAPVNGGAINVQSSGMLTVVNSTFSGNTSGSLGGAMSSLGTLTIVNTTIAANQGSSGSAVAVSNTKLTIDNSVFTGNAATSAPGAIHGGDPTMASNNVFFNNTVSGTADDQTGYATSNFIAATAEPLAPLGYYGGTTLTMLPLTGQAAVCAGSLALLPPGLTQDQRGFPRTSTYGPTTCVDAGAAQLQNAAPAVAVPALSMWLLGLLGGLLAMFGIRRARRRTV